MRRILVALALASLPAVIAAQNTVSADRLNLDLYWEYETVSDPQLSPDGAQILYTRGWIDKINDKRESSLWIMNADGSRNRFLVARQQRALVAERRSHCLHGAGRSERLADLRALHGRRGRGLADHARQRVAGQRDVVAGRHSRSPSR